jgi:type I restriction enzyme S subunit
VTLSQTALPPGWAEVRLRDIVEPSQERVHPDDAPDARLIGLEHIESGTNRIIGSGLASDVRSTKTGFRAGDVLYGRLRPYLNKVCVPAFDGVCSTDILVFPKSEELDSRYLMWLLSSPTAVEFAQARAKGINLPRVSFAALGELSVKVPPFPEQLRIADKVEAFEAGLPASSNDFRCFNGHSGKRSLPWNVAPSTAPPPRRGGPARRWCPGWKSWKASEPTAERVGNRRSRPKRPLEARP